MHRPCSASIVRSDPQTTVTSVNGVTASDLIFRRATSTGFRHVDGGSASPFFVRMFHGSPSECLWEDDSAVTKIWNKAGLRQGVCDVLETAARDRNHRPVWRGPGVPVEERGIKILGTPIGHPEHVRRFLVTLSDEHQTLLPLGRRRASNFAPPGSLCSGEGDGFVAVCRPRGSGRVRQEARPGHVGVLEVHSARQPRGLGRRNEGHRPVANVFGRFGCAQQPTGPLGPTACP